MRTFLVVLAAVLVIVALPTRAEQKGGGNKVQTSNKTVGAPAKPKTTTRRLSNEADKDADWTKAHSVK